MAVLTNCVIREISRRATYSRDGLQTTRVLDVTPFGAVGPLAYEMLGGPRFINGRIIRRLPERDPWLPQCFCSNIESEGMGAFHGNSPVSVNASGMLASQNYYDFARLTVTYKTPDLNFHEGATPDEVANASGNNSSEQAEIELANQSFDFSAQALTLPLSQMKFKYGANGNTAFVQGANGTKVIPRIDYTLQRHYCANRPIKAISALVGKINKSTFNVGAASWPPETLRFDGANIQQKIDTSGFKFFDITYKFAIMPVYDLVATSLETISPGSGSAAAPQINPSQTKKEFVGWNRIYRPDRGYWDYLQEVNSPSRSIYQFDYDVTISGVGRGFNMLFNPRAY